MIVPLAYKYVAVTLMLAEINFCASRLHLTIDLPIKEQDIKAVAVFPPRVIGFAGRIDTKDYSFSFAKSGRLRFITKLEDGYQSMGIYRGSQVLREYHEHMSKIKSTIDTNDAYRIATNWLVAVDVDVQRLEKAHPSTTRQQSFISWPTNENGYGGIRVDSEGNISPADGNINRKSLPLFDVYWGNGDRDKWGHAMGPAVDIMISGVNGELLKLRQEDDSYSKRPVSLIKDMDKLLAIPDEDFLKYSPTERSNLVARFAAVHYSASTNELRNLLSQTNAPAETIVPATQ